MTEVNPADLRFTQGSIACHFKTPYEHFSIREALQMIQAGEMSPDDFPRLRVIPYNGCLWSIDNRRLWVFRKGKCSQITVIIMSTMHPRLMELISLRSKYVLVSKPEFFPRVRRSQRLSPILNVAQKVHPSVTEMMSRCGPSSVQGSQNVTLGPLPRVASENLHSGLTSVVREWKRPTLPELLSPNPLVVTMEGWPPLRGLCSPNPVVVTVEGWPPLPRGPFSRNPSLVVTKEVSTGLLKESSNAGMEPLSASFSGASGGRHDSAGVTRRQPTNETNDDVIWSLCYTTGTQDQQSRLEKKTSGHSTPLLPASTSDNGPPTQSWFGLVKNLIVRFFGRG